MAASNRSNENKGPELMAVMWTLTGLSTAVTAARLLIRHRLLRYLGLDDWLIAISIVFGLVYAGTTAGAVSYGYGKHTSTLPIPRAEKAATLSGVCFIFGILSFALPKLAIAALLVRIMNPNRLNFCILWGLAGSVAVASVVNIILYVTTCKPPVALWKFSMVMKGEATCRNPWVLVDYATFNGSLSAFVDMYLAIYPSTVLLKLNMSFRKRVALSVAFGMGTAAAAIAIVKCIQLKGLANTADSTYGTVPLVLWTNVEANVVVLASCIPTLQPLLDFIMGKGPLSSRSRNHYYYHESNSRNTGKWSSRVGKRENTVRIGKEALSHTSDMESQRSILQNPETDTGVVSHPPLKTNMSICRTDDVTVEYEMHPKTSHGSKRMT